MRGSVAVASVHDVAAYVLQRTGSLSTMKLQKLCYYAQAWHLVWEDEPLFSERIEAWANGPVVYELFDAHRGSYTASNPWPLGDPFALNDNEKSTIDAVVRDYGKLSGQQLSALTHSERPWLEARAGLTPTARSNAAITVESLADFYGALAAAEDAKPPVDLDW
jgi:uncharacterized phage-associated protein